VADRDVTGTIFNVQRYSLHDGAGIRTIVFLKGCPLRCQWCSNPESQQPEPELARNPVRCLGVESCGWCGSTCSAGALVFPESGAPVVDRDRCLNCMLCAGACPAQALTPYGRTVSVGEVVDLVERDSVFFSRSGGGMTLSGGEPLLQSRFALALLREARKRRIDCAIETCGHVPWGVLAEACGLAQAVFFDLKVVDSDRHETFTGLGNGVILRNFRRMAETFPELTICVRTPIIPGCNDTADDIGAILDVVGEYPRVDYAILPYHRLGSLKYQSLDRAFPMGEAVLDSDRMDGLRAFVTRRRTV
jgi:pyruvate formate lyase activating enzyme